MEMVPIKTLDKIQWNSGSKAYYLENPPIQIQPELLIPAAQQFGRQTFVLILCAHRQLGKFFNLLGILMSF